MKNKALLVGINDYPLPGNDLRGCINDLEDMGHFIAEKNKVYAWENIRSITDRNATRQGILTQLDWLLEGVSAGDQLLFSTVDMGHNNLPCIQPWKKTV